MRSLATRTFPSFKLAALAALAALVPSLRVARASQVELASYGVGGVPAAGDSRRPAYSEDGKVIAFDSVAQDVVFGSGPGRDVFVLDATTGIAEWISRAADGGPADGDSDSAALSEDGRFVVFRSTASNLVDPPLPAHVAQIYLRDRSAGVTQLASRSNAGAPANSDCAHPAISGDGLSIAFDTAASNLIAADENGKRDVFVFDVAAGTVTLASRSEAGSIGDDDSIDPSLSRDGSRLVFASRATNLVPEDGNGASDVFLRIQDIVLVRATRGVGGEDPDGASFEPRISANGRVIVFSSAATNLVPDDANGKRDVFVVGFGPQTERVSVRPDGTEGSADSSAPAVSASGHFVAFTSSSPEFSKNLGGNPGVFVADTSTRKLRLVSRRQDKSALALPAIDPSLDGGGTRIAFSSADPGFSDGDANGASDVFVERTAFFVGGDTLAGRLDLLGSPRDAVFDGVKNMRLTVAFDCSKPGAEVEVRVIAPSGGVAGKFDLEDGDSREFRITKDGPHRLRVRRRTGQHGDFTLTTAASLPKKAADVEITDRSFAAGDRLSRKVAILPGSGVAFQVAGTATEDGSSEWRGAAISPGNFQPRTFNGSGTFGSGAGFTAGAAFFARAAGRHRFEFETLSGGPFTLDFSVVVIPAPSGREIAFP